MFWIWLRVKWNTKQFHKLENQCPDSTNLRRECCCHLANTADAIRQLCVIRIRNQKLTGWSLGRSPWHSVKLHQSLFILCWKPEMHCKLSFYALFPVFFTTRKFIICKRLRIATRIWGVPPRAMTNPSTKCHQSPFIFFGVIQPTDKRTDHVT